MKIIVQVENDEGTAGVSATAEVSFTGLYREEIQGLISSAISHIAPAIAEEAATTGIIPGKPREA